MIRATVEQVRFSHDVMLAISKVTGNAFSWIKIRNRNLLNSHRYTLWTLVALIACGSLTNACAAEPTNVKTPEATVRELTGPDGRVTVTCSVYAPRRPQRGAGLVVHLYGSGGSIRHGEYNVGRAPYAELRSLLSERGYWLVVPELGPKHWMNDVAEKRLDFVIATMVEHERVDPSRVHLLGSSMGGGSSLVYAMRHPDAIASVVAIFPMTDFSRWLVEKPGYRSAVEKAHGITADNRTSVLRKLSPLHHPAAFRTTPVQLLHGASDTTVGPHHSREFAAQLRAEGYAVHHREVTGERHRDEIVRPYQTEIADFLTRSAVVPQ